MLCTDKLNQITKQELKPKKFYILFVLVLVDYRTKLHKK